MNKAVNDVRIVKYDTQRGVVISVTFHNNVDEIISTSKRIELSVEGDVLYFNDVSKRLRGSCAINSNNHTALFADKSIVAAVSKFIGEYEQVLFDTETNRYYVSLKNWKPVGNTMFGNFRAPKNYNSNSSHAGAARYDAETEESTTKPVPAVSEHDAVRSVLDAIAERYYAGAYDSCLFMVDALKNLILAEKSTNNA